MLFPNSYGMFNAIESWLSTASSAFFGDSGNSSTPFSSSSLFSDSDSTSSGYNSTSSSYSVENAFDYPGLSSWWEDSSHFNDPYYREETDGYGYASLDRMVSSMSSFIPPYPGNSTWTDSSGTAGYYGDLYSSYSSESLLF